MPIQHDKGGLEHAIPLTKLEAKKLKKIMEGIHNEIGFQYQHISGGFTTVEIHDMDEDSIWLYVTHGIQSDVENTVYKQTACIDRETFTSLPIGNNLKPIEWS